MDGIASDIRGDVASEVQATVSDVPHIQEGVDDQHRLTQTGPASTVIRELPPPPPPVFFGRRELIESVVDLAQDLTPIALIGAGGIGKTSIVLAILHDDRIKQRFGDNRWFIRCDQFPASHTHLLLRLSEAIGAGVKNPQDLIDLFPLQPYLSSKEMMIVLDNVEFILDPGGPNAQEIYGIVDELSRFSNVCLCLTSRISTIPPSCETFEIPTFSREAAHDTFYHVYKRGERSDSVSDILEQLDFHPLSITLLATAAQYNKWNPSRLAGEWERQQRGMLRAQPSESLAAAIGFSLSSPIFQDFGPDARTLLEVVAFFPQGINEEDVDWLFPTISLAPKMFDTFCILSVTYRSNGFIMMLAPVWDYLYPMDQASSPLLNTAKERYLTRLSTGIDPDEPSLEESRWITSEDVNIEHLLDIFTSLDPSSEIVWDACAGFLSNLYWYKPQLTTLGPKIEALSDNHPSKAKCLRALAFLFDSVGDLEESKRLHTDTLNFWREKGDDRRVAKVLLCLSDTNRLLGLRSESKWQSEQAFWILNRLANTAAEQARLLFHLARAWYDNEQLEAAEEAALCGLGFLRENGKQLLVCQGHRLLGQIYSSKGETRKAVHSFETALEIATTLGLPGHLFWIHCSLAEAFSKQGNFDTAHDRIEHADNAYNLGLAMELQARLWVKQGMFEKARLEASRAVDAYGEIEATTACEECEVLLRKIDELDPGDSVISMPS